MSAPSLTRICWFVLRASTALALTVAPYRFTFDGAAGIGPASVHAEDGDGGGDGGEGGGGGGDDGGHDGSGTGSGHVNPATGDKVSIHGSTVQVIHPDGLREKIENGRFVMKDALGRTIVERAATAADLARLKRL